MISRILMNLVTQHEPDWISISKILQQNAQAVTSFRDTHGSDILHFACARNAPIGVVRQIVQQRPDAVKEKDNIGFLPLHCACARAQNESLQVIQLLVRQHHDAVKVKADNGFLPLHCACAQKQSLQVIQFLVKQHPSAVRKEYSDCDLPLHVACANNQSLQVIQWLVKQNPNAVKKRNSDCDLPLHLACVRKQSLQVIQFLVKQHPYAVKEKCHSGCFPIHLACQYGQSLEVIKWLIQKHPRAVTEKNKDGNSPLHLACAFEQSFEVIHLLVQQYPDAITEKNNNGDLALQFACIKEQSFEVIDLLVQHHPDTVAEKNKNGDLALHLACVFKHSLKAFDLLVQHHPDTVTEKNNDGCTPLHLACRHELSCEVVDLLVKQHPDVITENNNDGDLALHLACAHMQSLEVIQLLVQHHPDTVTEKNKNGDVALHVACEYEQTFEVIALLVQLHPDVITEKNNDGDLALHLACMNEHSFEVIDLLVQQHPEAITEKNNDGDLALHLACMNEHSFEVIHLLVRHHPDTVTEKDKDGDLALHLACMNKQSFEVIDLLVQQHPEAITEKNNTGDLALHLAFRNSQSFEVIDLLVQQHPNAITEKDNNGNLALHLACMFKHSLEVFDLLIRRHPDAVTEKNKDGNSPFHLACACEQPFEVIDLLVQKHPDAITEKCDYGFTPLQLACMYKQSFEVIELLVQQYPDAITEKSREGDLALHMACESRQSLEVIQLLVQHHPDTVTIKNMDGRTPCDLARCPEGEESPDDGTVCWLEALEFAQINVATQPTSLPRSRRGEEKSDVPSLPPTDVDLDLAKPSHAATNDAIPRDPFSVQDISEGTNEVTEAAFSYLESIRTREVIQNGFFGTACKGADMTLHSSFAVKTIHTELLADGDSAEDQKAKDTFLMEIESLSLFRHSIMDVLYAGACPDYVRCSFSKHFEKVPLEAFWKADLGPERLSLFRRRIEIALDVIAAIRFLHVGNDGIASCWHGDIKSANIVLQRNFTAQLINCGLSKDVINSQSDTGITGSTGEGCREHVGGSIQFARSCDIFSFGAVLAELLTGTVQNRNDVCSTSFNFVKHRIQNKTDLTPDSKMALDPVLGYDTWALPNYVQNFADMTISCIQSNPDDRPLGDAVMAKLVSILSQCGTHNNDVDSSINTGNQVTSSLENPNGKCKFCRTFPPVSLQDVCAVCQSAQERRARLSFRCETSGQLAATKAKLDATHPFLIHLDIRLKNPVPRLFLLVPFAMKTAMKSPRTWLRKEHRTWYNLYFVCMHSMNAVEPPIPILVTKRWVEKVAPVLATSLVLLLLGLKPDVGIDVGFRGTGLRLKLTSTKITELLDSVGNILMETGSFDFFVRLRRNLELDPLDTNQLNDEAYELIVERACEERGWRDRMEPVRKNGSPQICWVSKEVASNTSNEYEIVHMS